MSACLLSSLPACLDLASLPLTAVLSAHLKDEERKGIEETLRRHHAPLYTDVSRARLFIGKVSTKKRAEFELRSRKFTVEDIYVSGQSHVVAVEENEPPAKRRKVSGLSTTAADGSETGDETISVQPSGASAPSPARIEAASPSSPFETPLSEDVIWVVRASWLDACVAAGRLLPLYDNLVLKCKVLERPKPCAVRPVKAVVSASIEEGSPKTAPASRLESEHDILEREKADATVTTAKSFGRHAARRPEDKPSASTATSNSNVAHLLQQTTSEYEGRDSEIPRPPEWVTTGIIYSCQRVTPSCSPNKKFIEQLKQIRLARILIEDEIGVRAYSSMIASIAAYPYKLSCPRELLQLPACEKKASALFVEWKNTGKIQAVEDFQKYEVMKTLRYFYDIWGVGAKTARQFYYNNGWRDLDDITEFGWHDLDRLQQIGVKYYEEFKLPIPRSEVEYIAAIIRNHAVRLRDHRITTTIVGGYRRSKPSSGNVDVVVSHPDLSATANFVRELVASLQADAYITHTLSLSLCNTKRGQTTLSLHSSSFSSGCGAGPSTGFDTLDKALVVWQDPQRPPTHTQAATDPDPDLDPAESHHHSLPRAKNRNPDPNPNPAPHRRVNIVVSPWRTVGCAVLAWTGGTTFQRGLRRYAKRAKGWRFDGSGVRDLCSGEVVLVQGEEREEELREKGRYWSPEDAERAVFESLGLAFVPPEGRATY